MLAALGGLEGGFQPWSLEEGGGLSDAGLQTWLISLAVDTPHPRHPASRGPTKAVPHHHPQRCLALAGTMRAPLARPRGPARTGQRPCVVHAGRRGLPLGRLKLELNSMGDCRHRAPCPPPYTQIRSAVAPTQLQGRQRQWRGRQPGEAG